MKSAGEFASGLDGMFDGVHVYIKENAARNTDSETKKAISRAHIITMEARNEADFSLLTPDRKPLTCEKAFEDQVLVVIYKKGKIRVLLRDTTGEKKETQCIEYEFEDKDYFTEDHDAYIFLAAQSGTDVPNEHNIHNIRFYDINHLHDDEFLDSADEMRAFKAGKAQDHIRKGHI